MNKNGIIGKLLLLGASLAWGSAFFILKDTIENYPMLYVLAVRFFVAGVILACIFYKKLKKLTRQDILRGVIMGVIVAIGYIIQTMGLKNTTPGRNAFITAVYCIIVPFAYWILFKNKPKRYDVIAAILAVVGIGMIALTGDENGGNYLLGDSLTLVASMFYAAQLIAITEYIKSGTEPVILLVLELLTTGIICAVGSAIFELPIYGISALALDVPSALAIAYLTLVCTGFAQFAQIFGQRYTAPAEASIILSLEAVFGALFSVIFGSETLVLTVGIGFAVVFCAILVSELGFDPIGMIQKSMKKRRQLVAENERVEKE